MGTVKQHALTAMSIKYGINLITKELARRRKWETNFRGSDDEAELTGKRLRLRRELRDGNTKS
jgi:hypothetical protein